MNDRPHDDPLANVPGHSRERVRLRLAGDRIVDARIREYETSDEDAVRELGYANLSEYFDAALARPMSFEEFIFFIKQFHKEPTCSDDTVLDISIRGVLRDAVQSSQAFIYPQTPGIRERKLDPRAASVWLLSIPTERGLLPAELVQYLEGPEMLSVADVAKEFPALSRAPVLSHRRSPPCQRAP